MQNSHVTLDLYKTHDYKQNQMVQKRTDFAAGSGFFAKLERLVLAGLVEPVLDRSQPLAVLLILYSALPTHGSLQTYVACHSHRGRRDLAQNFVLQLQRGQRLILKLHNK